MPQNGSSSINSLIAAIFQPDAALSVVAGRASFQRMATPATVKSAHIKLDARGVAWIDDTNTKVIEVAQDMIAHGWSPEEIHFQHSHLSLAQIHSALGYYYDHQAEFDKAIAESLARADKLAAENADSTGRRRLRAMGLI